MNATAPVPQAALDRFWSNVRKTETCWLWVGYARMSRYGGRYGYLRERSGLRGYAHRFSFFFANGHLPEELDHVCRQTLCVNPNHLEAVSHAENMRRARKSVCKNGHPLVESNVYLRPDNGQRQCRACAHERYENRRVAAR